MDFEKQAKELNNQLLNILLNLNKSLKGNKTAGTRFRVSLGKLKKQITEIKSNSIKFHNQNKKQC
jgi:hypothetical protein